MTILEKAIQHCRLHIGEKAIVTDDEINEAITIAKVFCKDLDERRLRIKLASIYSTSVDSYRIIQGPELVESWLNEFKAQKMTNWTFWQRYKSHLVQNEGFEVSVINQVDKLTDDILDNIFNPRKENIQICKKGLVVGQVQSGKTANFTGLICKAADAGFNLIIVFAGILDDLRAQTQERLEKGFLGFSTYDINSIKNSKDKIGVGFIDSNAIAHSLTTKLSDFKATTAVSIGVNFQTKDPILFVVKKNGRILNNLYDWLAQRNIDNKTVLIIDDEADNASINVAKDDITPSTINLRIRTIVNMFKKAAYVGYTATPFANIFISPKEEGDLFPRHFIVNIPTPANYVGPEKIFGTTLEIKDIDEDILPIVRTIDDYEDFIPNKHKMDDWKDHLTMNLFPESLKIAIKCFIITCAIRIARGDGHKHNSMLIHISRFKKWQGEIKDLVEKVFNFYKQEIEANDESILKEFRRMLEVDSANYKSYRTITKEIKESSFTNINQDIFIHEWEEIKPLLFQAVNKIEIKALYGNSGDSLLYEQHPDGLYVIAIGGNKLSRGLTLNGLSVSYFLRSSKMYDTLMQMGRWFGYRPGYVDLCRLFTSSELNIWFKHITMASEELREEFNYLSEAHMTPEDYALKVRTSPGLLITSPLKMRDTTNIQVSWASKLVETYALPRDKGSKNHNLKLTDNFISSLGLPKKSNNHYLWKNINPYEICNFLTSFRIADSMKRRVDLDLIVQYIQDLNTNYNELTSWHVVIINISDKKTKSVYTFSNGIKINCGYRTRSTDSGSEDNIYYIKKNHILGGQEDEFIDLEDEYIAGTNIKLLDAALERTKELRQKNNREWKHKYPAPEVVRQEFRSTSTPVLILYPLNPKYSNILDNFGNEKSGTTSYEISDNPFIGFAISFPRSKNTQGVHYQINKVGELADFAESEDIFEQQDDNTYD